MVEGGKYQELGMNIHTLLYIRQITRYQITLVVQWKGLSTFISGGPRFNPWSWNQIDRTSSVARLKKKDR